MQQFQDQVAAITGAASGIGRALALRLAQAGCHLGLSDIDDQGLEATAATARATGVRVVAERVDVADRAAVEAHAATVIETLGTPTLVVNNAGVSLSATVDSMTYEDFEWLMGINFWGVVYGTKAYLPAMLEARRGTIVNLSSIFGVMAMPTQSAYNAAKFAVRGFTESLNEELRLENTGVRAVCVHPGGIKTNIVANARLRNMGSLSTSHSELIREFNEELARTTAEQAAKVILDGVVSGRSRILIGSDAKLLDTIVRLLPERYQGIIVWGAKRKRAKVAARSRSTSAKTTQSGGAGTPPDATD